MYSIISKEANKRNKKVISQWEKATTKDPNEFKDHNSNRMHIQVVSCRLFFRIFLCEF